MNALLLSNLGGADAKLLDRESPQNGPLAACVRYLATTRGFKELFLGILDDGIVWRDHKDALARRRYEDQLRQLCEDKGCRLTIERVPMDWPRPLPFLKIFNDHKDHLHRWQNAQPQASVFLNFSSGLVQMQLAQAFLRLTEVPQAQLLQGHGRSDDIEVVTLPFELATLALKEQERRVSELASRRSSPREFGDLKTWDPELKAMCQRVAAYARADHSVLLLGETGTGKELMAEYYFQSWKKARTQYSRSRRYESAKLIPVNCATLEPSLADSLLFGAIKGAHSTAYKDQTGYFHAAENSVLFLDEFGDLPPQTQNKLLRALSEEQITPVGAKRPQDIHVRVIAATSRPRDSLYKQYVRSDLLHRLNTGEFTLPPLRSRHPDEVVKLAHHFLNEENERIQELGLKAQGKKQFADKALHGLHNYHWPGNVRELKTVIQRAHIESGLEPLITQSHIARALPTQHSLASKTPDVDFRSFSEALRCTFVAFCQQQFGAQWTSEQLQMPLRTVYKWTTKSQSYLKDEKFQHLRPLLKEQDHD